jgi:hypothetical protein
VAATVVVVGVEVMEVVVAAIVVLVVEAPVPPQLVESTRSARLPSRREMATDGL